MRPTQPSGRGEGVAKGPSGKGHLNAAKGGEGGGSLVVLGVVCPEGESGYVYLLPMLGGGV